MVARRYGGALNNPSLSLRRLVVGAVIVAALVLAVASLARSAGGDKRLDRIKGNVGYTTAPDAPVHQVFGQDELADNDYAITRAASAAQVVLPDSSIVALGENTNVQVGAFTNAAAGPGSTIVLNGGSLRFDIHRPAGGAANYHFTTTTSQIAVRGTVGLLSFLGGNTTVACLACAADSVTVTTGTQTIALVTGQVVTVSAAGAVVTGTITSTTLSAFSSAQVSTVAASGPSAAVAGVTGTTAGVTAGTAAAAAAGAAAVGATVSAIAHTATPAPTPAPTVTPTASPTPSPSPSPSPTPNAPIQIQKLTPPTAAPTAAPAAVAPRPAAAPANVPLPEFPGGPHRGAH